MDEDARSANYDGPMETPPTLSPADKDYIVKLYSQIKPGILIVYVAVLYTILWEHAWARAWAHIGYNEHVYSYRPHSHADECNIKLGRKSENNPYIIFAYTAVLYSPTPTCLTNLFWNNNALTSARYVL